MPAPVTPDVWIPDEACPRLLNGKFAVPIKRPVYGPNDYMRWLTDRLDVPRYRTLHCSYYECRRFKAYTSLEWYRSYRYYAQGPTPDMQVVRFFQDGWKYLRVWNMYVTLCPEHARLWKELDIQAAGTWITRMHGARCFPGRGRTKMMELSISLWQMRFDALQRFWRNT
jgi:hypothetical protein